jgi:peptidyl-tRNA hydrolase
LTGGIGDKVGSISTGIIKIKEKYEGVEANKISIRNAVNAVKTGTHYRFISGVSKEDAKNIIASLVLRAPNIIIETIKIPPIPPSRPAISFKGLTYEQVLC